MSTFLAKLWKALHLPKSLQLSIMRIFQDQFLIGVSGIVFNNKNEILLFKHTYRTHPWSLPGGYLKAREHPMEGLEREIKEESGLMVSIDERLKIRTDRESARLDICYVGMCIGGTFKSSHEVVEAEFFSFEKLPLILPDQLLLIKRALLQRIEAKKIKPVAATSKPKLTFMQKAVKMFLRW